MVRKRSIKRSKRRTVRRKRTIRRRRTIKGGSYTDKDATTKTFQNIPITSMKTAIITSAGNPPMSVSEYAKFKSDEQNSGRDY
jgi:hypothetical protein